MRVFGICMTKDSEDIIYHFAVHALEEGLDGIIIANNMSTDKTQQELEKVQELMKDSQCKVVIVQDEEIGYYQSEKMTALAHLARKEHWADWIISMDDDELWYSHTGTIKETIYKLDKNVNVIQADLYNHFPSAIDPVTGNPFTEINWRQENKGSLPKVAVKYHKDMIIKQGNHSVELPFAPVISNCLEIRHFPYRSWEQFKRKAINGGKAYEATNLPEDVGSHWRSYNKLIEKWGDEVVKKEVYEKYFHFFSPIDNGLVYDPAPFRRWHK